MTPTILRAAVLGLAMAGLTSAAVLAEDKPAAPPSVITNPDWVSRPSAETFGRFYPTKAAKAEIAGAATVTCAVSVEGWLKACRLVSEAPAGWGFGEAALKLTPSFHMKPKTVDGKPVAGGQVTIPIRFRMAVPTPPTAPMHGRVTLQCLALEGGGLGSCGVIDEQPIGAGYDLPALRRAATMRAPSGAVPGEVVRLPVEFDGSPPSPPLAALQEPARMGSGAWWGGVLQFLFGTVAFVAFTGFSIFGAWLDWRGRSDVEIEAERDRRSLSALLGRD